MSHAVSRLRDARLADSTKPFLMRDGLKGERCEGCRLVPTHCLCSLRTPVDTRAAVCLLMADIEPLKPTNTGWLVADLVPDTFALGWSRTRPDPALLALLSDPAWDAYVVFPGEYAASARVVQAIQPPVPDAHGVSKRPLFILLDGTWSEARKMFGHSPYLNHLPVLSLPPTAAPAISQYRLRRSWCDEHLCTSEVSARCLALAGDGAAGQALDAYLGVFVHHYLQARNQRPVAWDSEAHQRWHALIGSAAAQAT